MKRKYGIGRTYWFFSLTIILFIGVLFGSLYIYSEYLFYKERSEHNQADFYERNQAYLMNTSDRVFDALRWNAVLWKSQGLPGQNIREMSLRLVRDFRTEERTTVYVLDRDGTVLFHPDRYLTGKNAASFSTPVNARYSNSTGPVTNETGIFIEHAWKERQHLQPMPKLSFVRYYPELGWTVGAEISLEKIREIANESGKDLVSRLTQRVLMVLSALALIITISTVGFYQFARRMRRELDLFISFFRNLTVSHNDIDAEKLTFYETDAMAKYANIMNRDIQNTTRKLRREIQDRKKAQEELIKLSQAVEQSPAVVVITDLKGVIEYVNPKFTEVTGFMPSEAVGNTPKIIRSGFQPMEFYQDFWKNILAGKDWKGEFHNKKKNGEMYWESALVTCIRNSKGKVTHFMKVSDDISERKRLEQNLEYLAHHDTLTGLPNRLLFNDRLNHAIARAHRTKKTIAVMILDLDNFKNVNDTLGHDAGDELLKMAVQRFMKYFREEDTASRMGGDEFNFILNELNGREDVHKILKRMMESFKEPFLIRKNSLTVTPSIGIALYPDDGGDMETLVKKADIALYKVKNGGKNNYRLFSADDLPPAPISPA